ncbi:DNA/RNA non-specific endonuclease [Streptomyces sp. NPDC087428]|uniref:DNA/RNA non-specific endonuclease n=1 Tax=Streptomyces sp. NPDC087428 TaxID=3365788 RepID=UPI0038253E36
MSATGRRGSFRSSPRPDCARRSASWRGRWSRPALPGPSSARSPRTALPRTAPRRAPLSPPAAGRPHPRSGRRAGHWPGNIGGGLRNHLIANILGGRISPNLVPCWQAGMNTGASSMGQYEEQALDEVRLASFSEDDAILYQVTPTYLSADSTIPVGVTVSAEIQREDGSVEQLFPDVYIANTQTGGQHNLGN